MTEIRKVLNKGGVFRIQHDVLQRRLRRGTSVSGGAGWCGRCRCCGSVASTCSHTATAVARQFLSAMSTPTCASAPLFAPLGRARAHRDDPESIADIGRFSLFIEGALRESRWRKARRRSRRACGAPWMRRASERAAQLARVRGHRRYSPYPKDKREATVGGAQCPLDHLRRFTPRKDEPRVARPLRPGHERLSRVRRDHHVCDQRHRPRFDDPRTSRKTPSPGTGIIMTPAAYCSRSSDGIGSLTA